MSSLLRIRLDVPPATPISGIMPTNAAPRFANLVEEKKRHKKEEEVSLRASKQRTKSDADAGPYARIRVGEEISNPMSSHFSLDIGQLHRSDYKGDPESELPNPGFPSPSVASVSSAQIQSQVVSSASILCQKSLPGFNQPTVRTNRRP